MAFGVSGKKVNMGASICIVAGKEGSGKTTITANLAIALSKLDLNVILVDGDLEGSSIGLMLGAEQDTPSMHSLLAGKISLENAIIEKHGIHALVGSIKLEDLIGVEFEQFPEIIKRLENVFDVTIVDSPGGLGYDAITVISSCKNILLVVTPDINSITNTLKIMVIAKKSGKNVIGAILNRSGVEYDIPREQVEDILNVKILGEIKEDKYVRKASQEGVPPIVSQPSSSFSKEISKTASEIIKFLV